MATDNQYGTHINYTSELRVIPITTAVDTLATNCTGIHIENKGETVALLDLEGVTFPIRPGDSFEHSVDPDVLIITVFQNVRFEGAGDNLLIVSKEVALPVREFNSTEA